MIAEPQVSAGSLRTYTRLTVQGTILLARSTEPLMAQSMCLARLGARQPIFPPTRISRTCLLPLVSTLDLYLYSYISVHVHVYVYI